MECREKKRWDRNFDKLSIEEVTELLSHAIYCDYHNCLVTEYEQSVLPVLDEYYMKKQKTASRGKVYLFFYDIHKLLLFAFGKKLDDFDERREIFRFYSLLKKSFAMNLLQTLFIMIFSIAIFAIFASNYTKNNLPTSLAQVDHRQPSEPVLPSVPSLNQESDPGAGVEPVAKLPRTKPTIPRGEFKTSIIGYSLNNLNNNEQLSNEENHSSGNDPADLSTPVNAQKNSQMKSSEPPVDKEETTYPVQTSEPKLDESNSLNETEKPVKSNQQIQKSGRRVVNSSEFAGIDFRANNKILFHRGDNQVVLSDWTNSALQQDFLLDSSQLGEVNNLETTLVKLQLTNLSEIDLKNNEGIVQVKGSMISAAELKPGSNGIYTFELLKGANYLITVKYSDFKIKTLEIPATWDNSISVTIAMEKQNSN